jgi:hypothetical protein
MSTFIVIAIVAAVVGGIIYFGKKSRKNKVTGSGSGNGNSKLPNKNKS